MIRINHLELLIFSIYFLLIILGIKEFSIWSQITTLLHENDLEHNIRSLFTLVEMNHPHTFRVFLIFPIYVISEYLFIKVEVLFSITILLMLFASYYLLLYILKDFVSRKKVFLILIFFIFISFFMNGRIMFSIFGNTLLLYLLYMDFYTSVKMKIILKILLYILSMFLVSVSSGTFMVYLLSILIFHILFFLLKLPYICKKTVFAFLFFIVVLILIYPLIELFINKNLTYFDNSIIKMLFHGVGKYIIDYMNIVIPFFILILFIKPFIFLYLKCYNFLILPFSMVLSSIFIGLFGLSSLVSGISAYLLFIYMFINRKSLKVIN